MPVFEGHPNNAQSKIQNAKTTVKLQEEFMLPMFQSQFLAHDAFGTCDREMPTGN
jgi:hypothetical protein